MQIMYLHPAWQAIVTLLAVYVLWLGLARTRSLHMGHNASFKRKRHIALGQVVIYGWLAGIVGGMMLAYDYWDGWLQTGDHAYVGMIMAALTVWGLGSGLYMAGVPVKRKFMPALHGLANAVLVGLAVAQFLSGDELLDQIMVGL